MTKSDTITKKLAALEVLKETQKNNNYLITVGIAIFLTLAPLNLEIIVGGIGLMICGYAYVTNKKKIEYLKKEYGV